MGNKSKLRMEDTLLISELAKQKKYAEALEICMKSEYEENAKVQAKRIAILANMNRYKEALVICDKEIFLDNEFVQFQKVLTLSKMSRYDEALEICNRANYRQNKYFKSQKKVIKSLKNSALELNTYELTEKAKILTRIYANVEKLFEINNSNIEYFDKQILLIAFYEKHNKFAGVKLIKELKNKVVELDKIRILNNLSARLNAKKKKFDIGVYEEILKTKVSFTYLEELKDIKEKEKEKKEEYEIKESKKVALKSLINSSSDKISNKINTKKEEKKYIIQTGQIINNRYNVTKKNTNNKKELEIKRESSKKTDSILLKEVFEPQIEEVQKYLYVKMQSLDLVVKQGAIKAWDIFENMINKSINDKENLERFLNLLKRIEYSEDLEIEMNDSYIKKIERRYF